MTRPCRCKKPNCGECNLIKAKIAFNKIYSWFPKLKNDVEQKKKDFEAFTNEVGFGEPVFRAIFTLNEYYWQTPPMDTPDNVLALLSVLRGAKKLKTKEYKPSMAHEKFVKSKNKFLHKCGVKNLNIDERKESDKQTKKLNEYCRKEGLKQ